MENALNKLKSNINKSLVLKFELNSLEQMKFVPINVRDNVLYVAINSFAKKEEIIELIKKKNFDTKFIQITEEEIDELLIYAANEIYSSTQEQGSAAPMEIVSQPTKRIGDILIDEGIITESQLIEALAESKRDKMPLGSALHKLGYLTIDKLKEVLHKQQGFDTVDSDQLKIQEKVIKMLPEDFIKTNKVIPISSDGRTLIVGMVNPNDLKIIKDIVYLTGQKPKAMIITHYEFQMFIDTFYSHSKKETKEIIQQIEDETLEIDGEESLWEQAEREIQDSTGSVAKFVNKIITDAVETKVSDIHIEPRAAAYIVRYRKDGILNHVIDVPPKVEQAVLTRFKVLARMNIAEHRRPQDGTFSIKYKNNAFDFRINSLPVGNKEKLVIRVLSPAINMSADDRIIKLAGGTEEDVDKITKMITCPNGIILASGPTGSGKTTTLYSILRCLNNEEVNITTIEDPVEIKLEGINQSQVNAKAGITFASCMRSILRQDPDIILVGEIRDYETLEVAISASLTGHLVLSTVHTNSAAATITRLIEMGAKDYLVSSTLSGVVAQRLVRRLCDDCKEEYYPSYEEAKKILTDEEEIQKFMQTKIYRKKGCENCNFDGYRGRLGVFEIMPITKEIKKLIAVGSHDIEIEDAAVACGMKTLNQACLSHILKGMTTTDEFIRVLGMASE